MWEFLSKLLETSDFPPRWHCGTWSAGHGWLHILSDTAIWAAYLAIPVLLSYFVLRRKDVAFPAIFWLFCAFIFSCGTVHLVEATIFWWPAYRLSGVVKLVTAVVSWATVVALVPVIPQALGIPGQAQMAARLQKENAERKRAEEALSALNRELERRISERTAESEQRAAELSRTVQQLEEFTHSVVGREDRIIELKRQVNSLAEQLGQSAPYDLAFVQSPGARQSGTSLHSGESHDC